MRILAIKESVTLNSTPNRLRLALKDNNVELKIYVAMSKVNDSNIVVVKNNF